MSGIMKALGLAIRSLDTCGLLVSCEHKNQMAIECVHWCKECGSLLHAGGTITEPALLIEHRVRIAADGITITKD